MKRTALLLLLAASPLAAQDAAPPPAAVATVVEVGTDRAERMTVQVDVDGRGPFAFIVDTGAERTAISAELADDLDLVLGRMARVHSMTEVSRIQTVRIPALTVGGKKVRDIDAPTLMRRNIGAEGILGIDSLKKQRVSFDFAREQMTVTASFKREEKWPEDTIVVTARNRLGHLVLVDAAVDGQKVWVIIDTGAQTTVGNSVLRQKLARKGRIGRSWPIELESVTGGRIGADAALVKVIRIGGSDIHDMPVAFADVHPFKALRLMDRPALLLGMDALRLFERVSVDFANRRVRLLPPERTEKQGSEYAAAD
jgi:predicted aspartyl protease